METIFVSPGAIWDGVKAIRGGVPLVFPQFGQPDKAIAQHGFARSSVWRVSGITDIVSEVSVKFALRDSPATREKWPYAFALEYTVTLGAESLRMSLKAFNISDSPFNCQGLLHAYFNVPDVADVAVAGLTGREYLDKVAGGDAKIETEERVELRDFTDRVYIGSEPGAAVVTIVAKDGTPLITCSNEGVVGEVVGEVRPIDVVVWNPYEGASPGDLPPPAFRNFVCVEPGLVSSMDSLLPGQFAEVAQTVTPASR